MYDFKHINTYETCTQTIEKEDSLNKIRNALFYIVILLVLFMGGLFALTSYQKESHIGKNFSITSQTQIDTEISHLQLSKAITQSVVKNLQSQKTFQKINDNELKIIIQKVVHKIKEQPTKTKNKE